MKIFWKRRFEAQFLLVRYQANYILIRGSSTRNFGGRDNSHGKEMRKNAQNE
jgi:hypothetical protein